jgi:uncharacterized membrane protein (DUF106 family)
MPELLEFQEVILRYPVIVGVICIAVALFTAVVTRWVDRSALDAAHERLAAYEDEVRRLNEAKVDLLMRLEERGDELRRMRSDLERLEERGAAGRELHWR